MSRCCSRRCSAGRYPHSGGELHWLGDALFVHALDWQDLRDDERRRIAEPDGEGRIANDSGRLRTKLADWPSAFVVALARART